MSRHLEGVRLNLSTAPMRIAIAQPSMYWTTAQNTARIVSSLAVASEKGAQLCLFPELALTGFHRGIREQSDPGLVESAIRQVRAACRTYRVGCAFGAPTFVLDGTIRNSHVLVDAQGELVAETVKDGLTPAEATFFARGTQRPVVRFEGRACATVICREVEDLEPIVTQLAAETIDLVFWPGLIGPPPGLDAIADAGGDPLDYLPEASAMARRLGAFVVQSNWPNALNVPAARRLGESKVIDATGELLMRLPRDEAGVAAFTLGERDFHWTPMPA